MRRLLVVTEAGLFERWRGAAQIGVVSACCATIGWVTLIVVARIDDPTVYASFAVLWAMYFFSAGALSGLQQEVTRSAVTGDRRDRPHGASVLLLGFYIGLGFAAVVAASYPLWAPVVDASWLIVLPIAGGAISLALFITALGVLAAQGRWGVMAGVLVGDALLRLGAVGAVGALTDSALWYAVAIVLGGLAWFPCSGCRARRPRERCFASAGSVEDYSSDQARQWRPPRAHHCSLPVSRGWLR